jgi:hypothetical protein
MDLLLLFEIYDHHGAPLFADELLRRGLGRLRGRSWTKTVNILTSYDIIEMLKYGNTHG